jgi:hypothetical protein
LRDWLARGELARGTVKARLIALLIAVARWTILLWTILIAALVIRAVVLETLALLAVTLLAILIAVAALALLLAVAVVEPLVGVALATLIAIAVAAKAVALEAVALWAALVLIVEAGLPVVGSLAVETSLIGEARLGLLGSAVLMLPTFWLVLARLLLVLPHFGLAHLRFKRGQRLHIATVAFDDLISAVAASVFASCTGALAAGTVVLTLIESFAVGENDTVIVLGVLEIIFSQDRIARCQRVARQ